MSQVVNLYSKTGLRKGADVVPSTSVLSSYLNTHFYKQVVLSPQDSWRQSTISTGQTKIRLLIPVDKNSAHGGVNIDYIVIFNNALANGVLNKYYFVEDSVRLPYNKGGDSQTPEEVDNELWEFTITPDYFSTYLVNTYIKKTNVIQTTKEQIKAPFKYLPNAPQCGARYSLLAGTDEGVHVVKNLGVPAGTDTLYRLYVLVNSEIGTICLCNSGTYSGLDILNQIDAEERLRSLSLTNLIMGSGLPWERFKIQVVGAWYIPVNKGFQNQANVVPVGSAVQVQGGDGVQFEMYYPLNRHGTVQINFVRDADLDFVKFSYAVGTPFTKKFIPSMIPQRADNDPDIEQENIIFNGSIEVFSEDLAAPRILLCLNNEVTDITQDFALQVNYNEAAAYQTERMISRGLQLLGSGIQLGASLMTGNVVGAGLGAVGFAGSLAEALTGNSSLAQTSGENSFLNTARANPDILSIYAIPNFNAEENAEEIRLRGYKYSRNMNDVYLDGSTVGHNFDYIKCEGGRVVSDFISIPNAAAEEIYNKLAQGVTIVYNYNTFTTSQDNTGGYGD